ncbi:HAMP domain-containing protein [Paraburkholderia sp. WC7.3g]|uniref:HAMP domain-containing protein n=1 Tax=Paraburkholderia sp. WC7.3g TaxID=2991070 RepID=UPI003D22D727
MWAITSPLKAALGVARRIAEGRLGDAEGIRLRGEFGQLLRALRAMAGHLARTVQTIKVSSDAILNASSQIADGNTDLSAGARRQAASLEETAASMDELILSRFAAIGIMCAWQRSLPTRRRSRPIPAWPRSSR